MKIKNNYIYQYYQDLAKAFLEETRYFPVKVNFIIQKNLKILYQVAQEIEDMRLNIIHQYGEIYDNNEYHIFSENVEIANKELNDLANIEQDINILFLTLEDIENIELTPAQMGAILFMIKENE